MGGPNGSEGSEDGGGSEGQAARSDQVKELIQAREIDGDRLPPRMARRSTEIDRRGFDARRAHPSSLG